MIISIVGYVAAVGFIVLIHVKKGLNIRILGGILFATCKYNIKLRFQTFRPRQRICACSLSNAYLTSLQFLLWRHIEIFEG